jgi:ribosomal protein L40E
MLSGQLPFQSHTPIGLIMKHLTETAPSILEIKADLPPGCEAVIAQALAKERDERYPTATALGAALVEAVTAKPADSVDAPVKTLKLSELKSARPTPEPAASTRVDPIVCPKCQQANPGQVRLCMMCGQRLKVECVQCYTANPLDATHFSNCGADLVRTRALRHQYQKVRQRTITERGLAAKEKEARQLWERIDALLVSIEDRRQRVRAYDQLNKLDDRAMKLLTDLMLQNPEPETRAGLAGTLGRICEKPKIRALIKSQGVKALLEVLEDAEPEVRSQAAAALGGVSGQLGQLAVEPLGALLKDSHETVRTQARQALQKIGGKKAQDMLDRPRGLMGWIKGI